MRIFKSINSMIANMSSQAFQPGSKPFMLRELSFLSCMRGLAGAGVPHENHEFCRRLRSASSAFGRVLLDVRKPEREMAAAERIVAGELRLLDLPTTLFKEGIDWHCDFYTGHRWPLRHFVRIWDPNDSGVDLNVPFELSRLQFLPTLLRAHCATSDKRYISAASRVIDDWDRKNPFGRGVNWWAGLEVGIRAVNLLPVLAHLVEIGDRSELRRWRKLLWQHGVYIWRYDVRQSHTRVKNNHHLGSMLGLLAVGLFFQGNAAQQFRQFALDELGREVLRQFHGDGGNFESATGYHQFSLEVYLVALLLLAVDMELAPVDCARKLWGSEAAERLEMAVNLVEDYQACYGESPRFGDSSDGRVLVFEDYFDRRAPDHDFILRLADRALGYKRRRSSAGLKSLYPESGYGLYRNDLYGLACFAGPKGTNGSGGHGHNDKTGFVLQVRGMPVIVESGTYIYNPDTHGRYSLKETGAHNVVMVDSEEQCPITPRRVFGLGGEIHNSMCMDDSSHAVVFNCLHDGYVRLGNVGSVQRSIECGPSRVVITDEVAGSQSREVSFRLTLAPDINPDLESDAVRLRAGDSDILVQAPEGFVLTVEARGYSDAYHTKTVTRQLVWRRRVPLPARLKTIISIGDSRL